MTPNQYKKFQKEEKLAEQERLSRLAASWHIPLSEEEITLRAARETMDEFKLKKNDVPLIIRLIENPTFDIGLFRGACSLFAHDCIHIILGRGVLPKDEAFVIGYTMGSTRKASRWRQRLFLFFARWFYPEGYKFYKEEAWIYKVGVIAGEKCDFDLSQVNFKMLHSKKLGEVREILGINSKFLRICYLLEKRFYNSPESKRLV